MITNLDFRVDPTSFKSALVKATVAYLKFKDSVKHHDYMVILNYKDPSYKKRLYVIDISTSNLVRAHHVAHGSATGCAYDKAMACNFSNVVGSRKTSLGAMITADEYQGKHGRSLRLHGLEKGLNDNVLARYVVIHSADYMTDQYILSHGRAGQSWGCPAVDPAVCDSLIDLVKGGRFVYALG